jgi:hypothetical protein
VIYLTFPETKGMTAEEAAAAFDYPRSERRGRPKVEVESLPTLESEDRSSIRDEEEAIEKGIDGVPTKAH